MSNSQKSALAPFLLLTLFFGCAIGSGGSGLIVAFILFVAGGGMAWFYLLAMLLRRDND